MGYTDISEALGSVIVKMSSIFDRRISEDPICFRFDLIAE